MAPTVLWAKSAHAKRRAQSLEQVTHADFVGAVQTRFQLVLDASTATPVTLLSVTDRPTPAAQANSPDAANEKFTLLLSGEPAVRLSQDTYHFVHPTLGEFDMFIAPLFTSNPDDNLYEAVFNRAQPGAVPIR